RSFGSHFNSSSNPSKPSIRLSDPNAVRMVSTRRVAASFDTRTFGRFLSTSSKIALNQSGWYNLDSTNQRSVAVSLIGNSTQESSTTTGLPFTVYEQPHQE